MPVRLDDEDRRAVDLLMERANETGDVLPVEQLFSAPVASGFELRLDAIESILGLLGKMPAEEPAEDLVTRTMERIRQAETRESPELPGRPDFPSQRPQA